MPDPTSLESVLSDNRTAHAEIGRLNERLRCIQLDLYETERRERQARALLSFWRRVARVYRHRLIRDNQRFEECAP